MLHQKNQPTNCYFKDNISITQVENIICEQSSATSVMIDQFTQDIDIVREILLRPFIGPIYLGGLATYKVYFGKNGGVFLLNKNKKKYLKIKSKKK
jgi:hypothetical protein